MKKFQGLFVLNPETPPEPGSIRGEAVKHLGPDLLGPDWDPHRAAQNLTQLPGITSLGEAGKPASTGSEGADGLAFGDLLQKALKEVEATQNTADQEAQKLMTGEATDMHTAILAVQKADVSFQMMMAVRSKLIDAYREVMRMQM